MLQLPDELIQYILRLAIPSEYHTSTYKERQDVLRAACLISRRFRPIAQPILREVMKVSPTTRDDGGVDSHLKQRPHDGVVTMAFELMYQPRVSFALCRSLRDVRLHVMPGVDMHWLAEMPALRRLVLSNCGIMTLAPIPQLEDLTCSQVDADGPFITTFFSSSTFPSLRALASVNQSWRNPPVLQRDLAAQLEIFVTDSVVPPVLPPPPTSGPLVLVDKPLGVGCGQSLRHLLDSAPHVRFLQGAQYLAWQDVESAPAYLAELSNAVSTLLPGDPHLITRRLYLPALFLSDILSTDLRSFLALCEARGIVVDYEDAADSFGVVRTSPSFWRFARAEREASGIEA